MMRTRREVLAIGASLLASAFAGCGPEQIGIDKDAFRAVDALYTAVSLRDPKLLAQCEGKLTGLRDDGKLPSAAFDDLEAIILEARGGDWVPAQDRLADFMKGQRR